MIISKYESYYNQIKDSLTEIKDEYAYTTFSKAFTHWFLSVYYRLDSQEIQEAIIDGSGDNGIDAILHNEEDSKLTIIQTKFIEKINKLHSEVDQDSILKTISGFKQLINRDANVIANAEFMDYKNRLKDKEIYNFEVIFLSFNNGIKSNLNIIENYKKEFVENTGSELEFNIFDKKKISNLYEKINRKNSVEIKFNYKWNQQAYNLPENFIDSYVSVVNAKNLVDNLEEHLLVIFDENIRLYENKSKVNDRIKVTASSNDSSMFYFYNNGIVFICDKVDVSPNNLSMKLKGASIVNGCQTINSLVDLNRENLLNEDVDLLVRTIIISDYDQRAKITEYLNSQTPIKDSYFISNNTIIRDLQKSLLDKGYFLERQINEAEYKRKYGEKIDRNLRIIELENTIQYYVAYWDNKNASSAKSGKNVLFNSNKIDLLLKDINSEKVIISTNMYEKISTVVTKYRKMRRNSDNQEFAIFMNTTNEILNRDIEKYLYINTGDILLLNACSNLKDKTDDLNIELDSNDIIRCAILVCSKFIDTSKAYSLATQTKSNALFKKVQDYIKNTYKSEIEEMINSF